MTPIPTWPARPRICLTGRNKENQSFRSFRALPRKDGSLSDCSPKSKRKPFGKPRALSALLTDDSSGRCASPGESDSRLMKRLGTATVRTILIACFLPLVVCGSAAYFLHPSSQGSTAEPFFAGLGSYSRKITTRSETAQKYFDQGLAVLYGFKDEAACGVIRCGRTSSVLGNPTSANLEDDGL